MPVIKSAKKKLKVDRKREISNKKIKASINFAIKKAQRKPTPENIQKAFKAIDRGTKKDVFHKNKAARIKSGLSKLISKKSSSLIKTKPSKPIKTKAPVKHASSLKRTKK